MAQPSSTTFDLSNMDDIFDISSAAICLDAGNAFIFPVSTMHTSTLDELLIVGRAVARLPGPRPVDGDSAFVGTGNSIGSGGGQTFHSHNFCSLLLLHKAGVFLDPWKLAKWLADQKYFDLTYILELQKKYGAFTEGFPAEVTGPMHGYEKGNEHTYEIFCIMDGCEDNDPAFLRQFLSDFALKYTVKKVEEQQDENAKLKDDNAKLKDEVAELKAKLKQFKEMQTADSEPATSGKRARNC